MIEQQTRAQLAQAQRQVDAEALAENIAKLKIESEARRVQRDAAHDAEVAQQQQELQDRKEAPMKLGALKAWTDNGGTKVEFEKEWPTLRMEMLRQRAAGAGVAVKGNARRVEL